MILPLVKRDGILCVQKKNVLEGRMLSRGADPRQSISPQICQFPPFPHIRQRLLWTLKVMMDAWKPVETRL